MIETTNHGISVYIALKILKTCADREIFFSQGDPKIFEYQGVQGIHVFSVLLLYNLEIMI